ncbi:HAUS augmin-like complex subunit 1 [Sinocyclocheilus anshuiensis]|uniref:HAUS augmin-like complex subunit 1 n=1 Tax=Sinocyclocheilus anshuiensis TaxID=1608454 RepID=UPI0007B9A911|nr:PREDICTED: HAUS augmin-like complex subunit 1 [Sinocyclocheilus anshuiensis]
MFLPAFLLCPCLLPQFPFLFLILDIPTLFYCLPFFLSYSTRHPLALCPPAEVSAILPPRVSQWLRKVFWQQPVPEFEVNTRTVEILYELAESSETRCREAELLIKDHEQKTEEYGSDGTHLQEVLLQAVGLQAEGLSRSTVDLLSALEGTAEVLKLRDTSLGR